MEIKQIKVWMNQALERIGESEQATCEVAMSVSLQLEREGAARFSSQIFPRTTPLMRLSISPRATLS
jgi:hypothetical protein